MDEADIKVAILTWVRRACRGQSLPVVTSEFSLNGTGVRADLAVLHGSFYGIEIKSSADTLKRLSAQMEGYARYFDQTIVVVAPKHLRALSDVDLNGAQVWGQSDLAEQRLGKRGARHAVCGHTLLGLLTASEERRAERVLAAAPPASVQRQSGDTARLEFEKAFGRRYAATSAAFWESVRGRSIRREDLNILSRFHAERQRSRSVREAEESRWVEWSKRMAAL